MTQKVNITTADDSPVFIGDKFVTRMASSVLSLPTIVTVVRDISPENLGVDRDFDVEDSDGNRLWNAYMVIKTGERYVTKELSK